MTAKYTRTARWLHWFLVPLIWGLFAFGKYLGNTEPSLGNFHLWGWHKSIGLIALVLVWFRLAWRLTHPPPPSVEIPGWQLRAASWVHGFLYALMILTPLFGWIASSSTGLPISFFGLFDVPLIGPEDEVAEKLLFRVHGLCATLLVGLSVVHLAAALFNHFVRRNDVLSRMSP